MPKNHFQKNLNLEVGIEILNSDFLQSWYTKSGSARIRLHINLQEHKNPRNIITNNDMKIQFLSIFCDTLYDVVQLQCISFNM